MMKIYVEGAKEIAERIWRVHLDPSEVRLLGSSENTVGRFSIILVTTAPDGGNGHLEFEPRHAHVLNIGSSSEALIIFAALSESGVSQPSSALLDAQGAVRYSGEDQRFLDDLPSELRGLGEDLLRGVRRQYNGWLRFYPPSGKYVEQPDNFWTVKIQRRNKSLRITVRGIPVDFVAPAGIRIVPDMAGYSAFKVCKKDEVDSAVSIIRQSRKK
jgi:hypothetical protein